MVKGESKLKRLLIYIIKRIIVLSICVTILVMAFTISSKMSNIFIILNDGMKARTEAILKEDSTDLIEFFSESCLENDSMLLNNPYMDYVISNYYYSLKIKSISLMPWSKKATAVVEQNVLNINGEINELVKAGYEGDDVPLAPPSWDQTEYKIELKQTNNSRWYINNITEIPLNGEN